MQIANQIYNINTAKNALIFFETGEQAYITKRFDIKKDGNKWGKEDFASLAGRSKDTHGKGFKYEDVSYEEIAEIMRKYVGAYQVEIEKFYKLILFNFLFSNGDAHLKNFSLIETPEGDYILSPAYDLLNTRIHVADACFALKKGLLKDGSVRNPSKTDLVNFGKTIGIKASRIAKIYTSFLENKDEVHSMIERSFLNEKTKKGYLIHYNTRFNVLSQN
jgi:serine/threonine-protein kinase HipA